MAEWVLQNRWRQSYGSSHSGRIYLRILTLVVSGNFAIATTQATPLSHSNLLSPLQIPQPNP